MGILSLINTHWQGCYCQ